MSRRARAVLLISGPVVLSVIAATIQTLNGQSFFRDSEAFGALAFISFGVVGGVILAVAPGHRMGRVFYGAGLLSSFGEIDVSFPHPRQGRGYGVQWAPRV